MLEMRESCTVEFRVDISYFVLPYPYQFETTIRDTTASVVREKYDWSIIQLALIGRKNSTQNVGPNSSSHP